MDPISLIPVIRPVVGAIVGYLTTQGLEKAGDKAAEKIGEKAADSAASFGARALSTLSTWLTRKGDTKARQALAQVEADPTNEESREKLVKETAKVARSDEAFAQELRILAEEVTLSQAGPVSFSIDNSAPNQGAQGFFNAPVTFGEGVSARKDRDG